MGVIMQLGCGGLGIAAVVLARYLGLSRTPAVLIGLLAAIISGLLWMTLQAFFEQRQRRTQKRGRQSTD